MSVLGHLVLAQRFAAHPENLATEALGYILMRSAGTRQAVLSFLKGAGMDLPELSFRTQAVGEDGAIPDLVGVDIERRERLIIEAKFDAGLTDNQPVTYLNRLNDGQSAVLLVIAPAWRQTLLWADLVHRCRNAGIILGEERRVGPELICRGVRGHHQLVIASWRVFLAQLHSGANIGGDHGAVADLAQLQGVCEQMDQASFRPIRSEELSPSIPERLIQLNAVVNDVATLAIKARLAESGGNRSGGARQYLQPLLISGFGCYLQVNSHHWAGRRGTPLWLVVQDISPDKVWGMSARVRSALTPLEHEDPPRVLYDTNAALIPLDLPLGAERPAVVEGVFRQLCGIAELLKGG